jgi:hypothetical protein
MIKWNVVDHGVCISVMYVSGDVGEWSVLKSFVYYRCRVAVGLQNI